MKVLRIELPGIVQTVNATGRNSHWNTTKLRQRWREDAFATAKYTRMARVDPSDYPVVVRVHETYTTRGKKDAGANFEASKAAIDGLVSAGVLIDDGPAYVSRIELYAPVKATKDALVIELVAAKPA